MGAFEPLSRRHRGRVARRDVTVAAVTAVPRRSRPAHAAGASRHEKIPYSPIGLRAGQPGFGSIPAFPYKTPYEELTQKTA